MAKSPNSEADKYANGVLKNRPRAPRLVKLAAERFLTDRANEGKGDYKFVRDDALLVGAFFQRYLKHSKGEWAGQVFHLEPWQEFVLWNLFGWRRKEDGMRRFRTAYIEVARKNGKSTLLAGTGLYLFLADHEPGAEVYTAATKRDQARITHSEATRMVQMSPVLRQRVGIIKNNLNHPPSNSKYEPLGADSDTLDGLNVHAAIIDELHAHKNRGMWDVLETATGSRRQPLQIAITTAGFDRETICWEQHDYVEKILEGVIDDPTYFGLIYTLDKDDDWQDKRNWVKANPNLGVSVKVDDLKRKANRVKEMPSSLNSFLRLHMNVWTQADESWILDDAWMACNDPVDADALIGRQCYGGLDLSSTIDVTAFVLCFAPEVDGEKWRFLYRFFIPADNIMRRVRRDRVPYDAWIRQGFVHATPGNVVDYQYVASQIRQDATVYDVREIAYDRWRATQIVTDLMSDGMTVVPFGQGFASMTSPTKDFERLVHSREMAHGANPVMRWMISNTVVRRDPADNLKPDKGKSTDRIDGVVASIMAYDRATRTEGVSVYETRGVVAF